ncbi:MAG: DUF3854 domain-containing protein [Thermodesulfobacteriota bacterium]
MNHKNNNPEGWSGWNQWIIDDLNKSGLTVYNFSIEPLTSKIELTDRLGFTHIDEQSIFEVGGYWIPYPKFSGYYRLKLKRPIETEDGTAKYLSPSKKKGFGNKPYIPFVVEEALKNYSPDKPVFITEGEKKAAKATIEGFPCIGLSGVWNYIDSESDFLEELGKFRWKDRKVYIIFDSDMTEKLGVRRAEIRLGIELMNRGATVFSVRLPNEPDGEKNGLDDFLVRYSSEAFRELI